MNWPMTALSPTTRSRGRRRFYLSLVFRYLQLCGSATASTSELMLVVVERRISFRMFPGSAVKLAGQGRCGVCLASLVTLQLRRDGRLLRHYGTPRPRLYRIVIVRRDHLDR